MLNVSFSGFRFCTRSLSVGAGGMVLSGRMIAVMGTSRQPLTVTGRRVSHGRTVGYGLSNGMVMPLGEIIILMESGVTIEGVHIVHGRSGTWLRGDPDAERGNNLGALPVID